MKPARELLRDYVAHRRAEGQPSASASSQEENLRRLLRRVGAAHQPSEHLESRLVDAMCRTARETPSRSDAHGGWPWLSRPVWRFAVPAAAGALVLLALFWPFLRPTSGPAGVAGRPAPGDALRHPDHLRQVAVPGPRTSSDQPSPIGHVILPQGELLRRPARGGDWEPLEGGDPVFLGDTMRTEAGSLGNVIFQDGSDCQFAANTTLRCEGDAGASLKRPARIQLTRGQLWVQIEKGGPEFRVVAPAASAVVQGTVFSVTVDGSGATRLQVTEGKVRLQNARGAAQVRAGRESLALVGGAPQPPFPIRRVLKPQPVEESGPDSPEAGAGDGAKKRPHPTTPGSRVVEDRDAAAGKLKRPSTTERYDPHSRPLRKPAPRDEPEEPPTAPIDSSGTPSDPETRLPVATGGP
jgi:hypothetical protein